MKLFTNISIFNFVSQQKQYVKNEIEKLRNEEILSSTLEDLEDISITVLK